MKKFKFFILLSACAILSTITVLSQKRDFSGSWKIDALKSTMPDYLTLARINIEIKGDSLLTERVYQGGDGQEYAFHENITPDGKLSSIIIYDMPRKSKAIWSEQDGSLLLESTTTFNGQYGPEDLISRETWKIDKDNNTLIINFKNKMSSGEFEGVLVFNKVK